MIKIEILFGEQEVRKYEQGTEFTDYEKILNIKAYYFNSELEKQSFIRGLEEGIGWNNYCIMDEEMNECV